MWILASIKTQFELNDEFQAQNPLPKQGKAFQHNNIPPTKERCFKMILPSVPRF